MKIYKRIPKNFEIGKYFKKNDFLLYEGDAKNLFKDANEDPFIDFLVTSPPYNIGKSYERVAPLEEYFFNQKSILWELDKYIKDNANICYQIGNFINKDGSIFPLDFGFYKIFEELGYTLKNRIIWHFGHGFHAKKRFSGRYETILWYSKGKESTFNLDNIRVPSKYPGNTYYKGPKKGKKSSHDYGKNPSDLWIDIPHVRGNHVEKTYHPCQFPIALIQRLLRGLTNENDVVLDPFMGVGSAGAACAIEKRKFIGCDLESSYVKTAEQRINDALQGELKYRPLEKPIYDHKQSNLWKKFQKEK